MVHKQRLVFVWFFALVSLLQANIVTVHAQRQYRLNGGGFGSDAVTAWSTYIAQEKMFLAREGIQFEFARSYDQMRALIGGTFDIIVDGISTTSLAAGKGADIVIVYDVSHRASEFIALDRRVRSLEELEGKTVGIGRYGTVNHLLLKQNLSRNGVDVNKIAFRSIGGSNERFAALYNKQISATLLSAMHAYRAQQEGMQIISLARELVFPWAYVVLRRSWAEANSDVIIRFLRGLHRATLWLYDPANFDDAVRTLSKVARVEQKAIGWALKNVLEDRVFNLEKPNVATLQRAVEWHVSHKLLAKPFDAKAFIDTKYYEEAVR